MTTNSSTAAARTEAGTVRVGTGRTARARRSTGLAPVVRYADAAGRARTAGPDTAASFVALTADDIDRDHGVALLEAAGHGVRILTQLTVDQHDAAFGARPWPVTEAEQLHGSADAIRVAVGGQWYELTRVQMPSGERRRFARQYNGYGDGPKDVREASMMFGCAWSSVPVVGWTEAEVEAEHEADAERMAYLDVDAEAAAGRPVEVVELPAAHPFVVGQRVEVDTRYLSSEPERWERATVYAVGGLLGDRNIEVEYAAGGVSPVAVARVRPAAGCQHPDQLGRIACGWGHCRACGSALRTADGRTPELDPLGQFMYAENGDQSSSIPDPPNAAGAGPAVTTYRTDPQT